MKSRDLNREEINIAKQILAGASYAQIRRKYTSMGYHSNRLTKIVAEYRNITLKMQYTPPPTINEMDIVGSSYKLLYLDEVGECVGKMN